jgi:hypothetical protein
MARHEVVGVGMSNHVSPDPAADQLPKDPTMTEWGSSVHEHVLQQVHVDAIGRKPSKLADLVR